MRRSEQRKDVVWSAAAVAALAVPAAVWAAPINTVLGPGLSWQSLGTAGYDTGLVRTERGGTNGQTVGPFTDTSFGVMNEVGAPWFTGNDLSAQQYIQRQIFGNFGTSSPPGPPGFRYYNFGYTGPAGPTLPPSGPTVAGSNFPFTAAERRTVTANHWNNPFPDIVQTATFGQFVYVPVAATLTVTLGWGGDEALLKIIGGISGRRSTFRVDSNLDASYTTTAFGGLSQTGNRINFNAITEVFDAGPGDYDVPYGYGAPLAGGQVLNRDSNSDFVLHRGVFVGDPVQGITPNSVGTSFTDVYSVLSGILQDGSPFTVQFDSSAELFIGRISGDADARANLGPGMEGEIRLVVTYEIFQAIPEPGTLGLLTPALVLGLRRRR
ncbi:MAG: hypothetical protein ACK4PI_05430 [Tepidisphaerales bacterium]